MNTCADDIATVASNTFIFGSKTSLNGATAISSIATRNNITTPNRRNGSLRNKNNDIAVGEFQNDRKKDVDKVQMTNNGLVAKNHIRRVSSPIPRCSSAASFRGSITSPSNSVSKPWFIASRNPPSLDELKELTLEMGKDNPYSNQQLDKDVLYWYVSIEIDLWL